MSEEIKELACNREAFVNDSSCSRGDVDTHAFDDLPFCCVREPTPPDGGFPQTDYPVVPFTPPPCSCIAVKASGGGGITHDKEPHIGFTFDAIGDCCEGNYEANVSVDIPCIPFDFTEPKKNKPTVTVECTSDSEGSGQIWIDTKIQGCDITLDPHLDLKIPMPKSVATDIRVEVINGTCSASTYSSKQESAFIESSSSIERNQCATLIKRTIKLHIPKPKIKYATTSITLDNTECGTEAKVESEETSSGSCYTKHLHKSIKLSIPKLPEISGCEKIVGFTGDYSGVSGTAKLKNEGTSCSKQLCPHVNLHIPPQDITMEGHIVDAETPFIAIDKQGTKTNPHFVITLGLHAGGGGSTSWSSGSSSSGSSGGSGGSGSSGGSSSDSFTFVENVSCTESGGLKVTRKRCVIDFENRTVVVGELEPDGEDTAQAEARLARDLLVSTVKAISNDPSILDIVDKPESEAAQKALRKIGIYSGLTESEKNEELLI